MLPVREPQRREDDAFFVDGIHDDILTQLSKVSALRVISRTSVEQFRDTKLSMKAIADQLGVTKILEGGVQRAGDRVRVTVQLIDAATDAHLWAENYDRELTAANIFAIQSEVAAAIAGALKADADPGASRRGSMVRRGASRRGRPTSSASSAWRSAPARLLRMRKLLPAGHRPRPEFRARVCWLGGDPGLQADSAASSGSGPRAGGEGGGRALELDPNLAEAWAASGRMRRVARQFEHAEAISAPGHRDQSELRDGAPLVSTALGRSGTLQEALGAGGAGSRLDPFRRAQCQCRSGFENTGPLRRGAPRFRQGDRDRSVDAAFASQRLALHAAYAAEALRGSSPVWREP